MRPQDGQEPVEEERAFKLPKLRLQVLDLSHPGASRFLAATNASSVLAKGVQTVLRLLYQHPSNHSIPGTRSVTLFLEDMDGVAYTKGSDLDDDHKEIRKSISPTIQATTCTVSHLMVSYLTCRADVSLSYIQHIKSAPEGAKGDTTGSYEINGVIVHELVHCFQHNGRGAGPGGLIEGIADWVRLRANLGAKHWKRDAVPDKWDQGYEKTAYFLDWLEDKFGEGTVRKINEALREKRYKHDSFWTGVVGSDIETLWKDYLHQIRKE